MTTWQPIHDNHAIDVMAVVVSLAEAMPEKLFRQVSKLLEEKAFSAGLRSRHALGAFQISISPSGGILPQGANQQGLMFNALFETPEGESIPGKLAEQVQIDTLRIIYRTWRYVSWSWQAEHLRSLVRPALDSLLPIVAVGSLRFEYLDRFSFAGPTGAADLALVLRKGSPVIPPYVFEQRDLFHSHTGAFIRNAKGQRRLHMTNIDLLDEPAMAAAEQVRWVNITTASEARFIEPVDPPPENADIIFDFLDAMHEELKNNLEAVITPQMASRIYLREPK
jgi:hypothetical protein